MRNPNTTQANSVKSKGSRMSQYGQKSVTAKIGTQEVRMNVFPAQQLSPEQIKSMIQVQQSRIDFKRQQMTAIEMEAQAQIGLLELEATEMEREKRNLEDLLRWQESAS